MADADQSLTEARNPDGSQRFYSPGQHPATQHLRDALARAEEYDNGSETTAIYTDHLRHQLARFEAGEDRAKRDYLRAHGIDPGPGSEGEDAA